MTNSNLMVVLSSPSGAGKTTLTKKIQQKFQNFKISVSHTTRKARPNEVDGIDYFFVEKDEFQKKIENKDFYEYAKIFNNYYGTSKESVNSILKNNNSILFDIDWQGNKQLSDYKELKLIKIFLVPPNKNELKKRLIQRNQDNKDVIKERLKAFDVP
jgi:guanylate kinase